MEKINKPAIVLLSGGQDSTTCLFWAKKKFDSVIAIGFDYGQKHSKELIQAKKIADIANVPYNIININGLLYGSSLIDVTQDVNAENLTNPDLPSVFTVGRNLLFLTLAASFGYNNKIFDIVTGVCQTDYNGFPDCRRVFIDSLETTLTLSMCTGNTDDFRIHTPLMYITKAETWKLAKDLSTVNLDLVNLVRTETLTDYNGSDTINEWGLGELDNPASILRATGYKEAKLRGWL